MPSIERFMFDRTDYEFAVNDPKIWNIPGLT